MSMFNKNRKMMKKWMMWVCALAVTVSFVGCNASAKDAEKDQVLQALNECAVYASDVLLDSAGKSRCDYNMILGKWYPYEEPWHTGQVILGLLESYKVTGNQKYLEAAKRAGDWWIGLEIKDHPVLKGMVAATHGDAMGNDNIVFATTSDGTPGIFELTRVTGDGMKEDLIAPLWSLKKFVVMNEIDKEMARRDSWQGRLSASDRN